MVDISEVRVKLIGDAKDRLKAYCSITIGGNFVIRDLKIIDGTNGLFVAMPSRKLAARCPGCHSKNHLRAQFCNECGKKFPDGWVGARSRGRNKLHADIAHPINAECRAFLQSRVIEEYEAELERAQQPGYQGSRYDEDDYDDSGADSSSPYEELIRELKSEQPVGASEGAPIAKPEAPVTSADLEPPSKPEDEGPGPGPSREPGDEFGAGLL
jgi:stage V sporulation protein G